MKIGRKIILIFTTLVLTGCSFLSPVKMKPESAYLINTLPTVKSSHRTRSITLLVMQPEIVAVLNTTQMAYTDKPHQISYFSQNRWAETPTQMLQPLLVKTLQNTHHFKTIASAPFIGRYDYVLNTQILQLQQNFIYRPAILQLVIRVQLSRVTTNQVIATKEFCVFEPMPQNTPYGGVIAANHAMAKILTQIANFCVQKTT